MTRATSTKKSPAKKPAAKQTAAKKTAAKKTAAKETAAKKTAAKQTAAKQTADESELVHCYRLIFQVKPGGSRKAESFVASTLDEAREAALADLESGDGAYHALCYGEQIVLQCWEGATKVAAVDLHPYITYKLAGRRAAIRLAGGDEPGLPEEDEELAERLVEEELEFTVKLDWAALRLPALKGRPVRPGETVALEGGRRWAHGYHAHWDDPIEV